MTINDVQLWKLRRLDRYGAAKELAAVKAGMDPKTARKYRRLGKLPSEVKVMDRDWLTRSDPFAEVWPQLEQLQLHPGLEAKTLFADLQRRFPGRFADGQLRTLQRRCREWRALEGPAKEVFFAQVHHPGRLCASDFTHCTELGVTINGIPFTHLIYHFVLTYSNWETGTICFSESLESLSEGIQNAVWELGGVPAVSSHRSADGGGAARRRRTEGRTAHTEKYGRCQPGAAASRSGRGFPANLFPSSTCGAMTNPGIVCRYKGLEVHLLVLWRQGVCSRGRSYFPHRPGSFRDEKLGRATRLFRETQRDAAAL